MNESLTVYVTQQHIGGWDRPHGGMYLDYLSPKVFSSIEKVMEHLRWMFEDYSRVRVPVPEPVQDEGYPDRWWVELQAPEPIFFGGDDPTKQLIRIQQMTVDGLLEEMTRVKNG